MQQVIKLVLPPASVSPVPPWGCAPQMQRLWTLVPSAFPVFTGLARTWS